MSDFTRDPHVEQLAMDRLNYSVGEIKRKTVAQLKKELVEKGIRIDETIAILENQKSVKSKIKKAVSSKSKILRPHLLPRRVSLKKDEPELDDLTVIDQLQQTYLAKIRFTPQLENDSDFSATELQEWLDSIERTRLQLQELTSAEHTDKLKKRWKRRQAKMAEMEQLGILDGELSKIWAEKQMRLLDAIEHRLVHINDILEKEDEPKK